MWEFISEFVIPNSSMLATDTFLAPPLTRGAGGVKSVASEKEIGIRGEGFGEGSHMRANSPTAFFQSPRLKLMPVMIENCCY